jgi:uncharacterized NAD(P)/FAD-binding protein YdhS
MNHHHIAIIGAGPRGTYAFRRLALALHQNPPARPVTIHVIEASGNFGGGRVHDPSQPDYLLLNTVADQITAVGDDDLEARQSPARRTLHGYLAETGHDIGPNDYPPRALHGRYLAAVFDWTEGTLPDGVTLRRHPTRALDIEPGEKQRVVLEGEPPIEADEVILLTGHGVNRIVPGSTAETWRDFADSQAALGRNLSYIHQVYPIERNTRHIGPGESVYVVGMGLTAIDVVRAFTHGRGGRFEGGRYVPSGREPHVILGSRLGIPYSARAVNQKTDQYHPRIFTEEFVRRQMEGNDRLDFRTDLFPTILEEMAYVYYATRLGDDFGERYLALDDDAARQALVAEHLPPSERFDWDALADPLAAVRARRPPDGPLFDSLADYTGFVLDFMRADLAEAQAGNMTSPIKTAIDSVLRDCRDILRLAVNFGGLTPDSHRYLNTAFDRVNNRIAVGPPIGSARELLWLAEAGMVGFSGPEPRIETDAGQGIFRVISDAVPGSERPVRHIINGRIHGVDVENDTSELIRNLLRRGIVSRYVNTDGETRYPLPGLDVTRNFHVIGTDGTAHPHICALGIPTEGKIWFNAADARPDVNSSAIGQLSDWAEAAVARLGER